MNEQLQSSYRALFGRAPTQDDMQSFQRIRDALHIKNDDALWSVLFVMQYYVTLYEKIPDKIAASTRIIQEQLGETSRSVAEACMAQAQEKLATAVANASGKVVEEVAGKQHAAARQKLAQWIAACAVALFVLACGLSYVMHRQGRDSGYAEGVARGYEQAKQRESDEGYKRGQAEGYREAMKEKAAASWANTAEGRMAAELAKAGAIPMLARCTAKGWQIKDGVCYPFADERGQLQGWRLRSKERAAEPAMRP